MNIPRDVLVGVAVVIDVRAQQFLIDITSNEGVGARQRNVAKRGAIESHAAEVERAVVQHHRAGLVTVIRSVEMIEGHLMPRIVPLRQSHCGDGALIGSVAGGIESRIAKENAASVLGQRKDPVALGGNVDIAVVVGGAYHMETEVALRRPV